MVFRRGRFRHYAILVLRCTLNNLFFTLRTRRGSVLLWASCGTAGFRGPRRVTPLAAEQTARQLADRLSRSNFRWLEVHLQSLHNSRTKAALKGLAHSGQLRLLRLLHRPPLAHNGVRPPKRRRV